MESFFSRYKNGLVLLGVLLVQLFALAIQVRRPLPNSPDHEPVRLLRYWMVSLVAPPARVSHGAGKGARGIWSNYIDLRNVREQNLELKTELDRLRLEEGALAEDARQGQRLQALLGFKERYIYKTTTAQVIGTAGSDRSRQLIIDKGSKDGLALDMPVITPDGIVGKVREVFPHTAQVLEISDQGSGAGVMLETTRIRGVMRGSAFGQPQIINIMPDDRIKPGERVVTSGGDQIFPRGLPVGVVDRVADDPDRNPYIDVIIKPNANLARLEEVLVITSTGDQIPPGEETDLAKAEAEAQQHSAAEVLSEKLPSIHDPNAPAVDPNAAGPEAATAAPDSEVARPIKPPTPLHPDRFTPGSSPDAINSLPGLSVPAPPHHADAGVAPEQGPAPTAKKKPLLAAGTAATATSPTPHLKAGATGATTTAKPGVPGDATPHPVKPAAKPAAETTPPHRSAATFNATPAGSPRTAASAPPSAASPSTPVPSTPSGSTTPAPPRPKSTYVEPYFVKPPPAAAPQPKKPKPPAQKPGGPRPMDRGQPTQEQSAPNPAPPQGAQ